MYNKSPTASLTGLDPNKRLKDIWKYMTHVLTAALKFLRAYNIKSSSTLFADKIPWNFMISFPCARFISQLGYKLIVEMLERQIWYFSDPSDVKLKKHALMSDILLWKHFFGYTINITRSKIVLKYTFSHTDFEQLCPCWNQQRITWLRCSGPPSSGEI